MFVLCGVCYCCLIMRCFNSVVCAVIFAQFSVRYLLIMLVFTLL